eukprot:CAMPEP_0172793548 /NCGR_PEP_ID=MMETSP1074-20121228/209531_1 /TAXON_ID=2916 /ORGANISM="Ceratium fusus, Strain PA161109" /LENGTH=71 /DNA_ID=CAMNT_0013630621 /DNA_START=202 /DNA_END=417 /DNA_ORIENTATION=+
MTVSPMSAWNIVAEHQNEGSTCPGKESLNCMGWHKAGSQKADCNGDVTPIFVPTKESGQRPLQCLEERTMR